VSRLVIFLVSATAAAAAGSALALSHGGASPAHAPGSPDGAAAITPERYARTVTRICERAVLFRNTHQIGTRAGAIAVSRDIRSTGRLRMRRVDAVPVPSAIARKVARWIATERKLDVLYADTYLRIWYQIEQAHTPQQRARLPLILHRLVDRPDKLKERAGRLELNLSVPDCTGGG